MCNSIKCGYHGCSNLVKPEEVVKNTLIYRSGNNLVRKEKEYCSKKCASHDQMAHEG